MTTQMYFVRPKSSAPSDANEQIAGFVVQRQGFIMMATGSGALLIAMDDSFLDALKTHSMVDFAGPISFNPHNQAGASLQRLFANNIARQLASRMLETTRTPRASPSLSGPKQSERR